METIELPDKYILYLHYKDLGNCYNENMEKLIEISDICNFWKTFNNIPTITQIFSDGISIKKMKRNNATPCAYSFFRHNIEPRWEDELNCNGFEYSIKTHRNFDTFHNKSITQIKLVFQS